MQGPFSRFLPWALIISCLSCLLTSETALAGTYANSAYPFSWIDANAHTKVGYNTVPYKFTAAAGCGTAPPTTDDTLSDAIPIGFNFTYAGVNFSTIRIMTNGRIQFNNNLTCGYGSPVQTLPYPNSSLNYTMRIYGNDLDPTNKVDVPAYNTPCLSSTTCYISYATIGSAPNRSFVVTWNNVPEWTTGSNPVGSYNLQIILQENGEFIYQYGTSVNGPSASLGQVGWHVDSTDYDTVATGFPTNNTAIKFYIPQPVAEYRMEQPSWTNAAGQVLDTSGNGRSGTVLGGPQTIANGKVCRGASFPYNASAATIDAINTGITTPSTVGSTGTITFWYKSNTAWSGGGVVDAQLLDATVVNNQWFFLVRRSNGNLRFVITDSLGNVRSAETAAIAVAANTWKHIAVSWSFNVLGAANSDRLRIYVDGVLQATGAFTTTGTISAQIGTLYIGDNRSGFTGSSGTGNSTNGIIDEFRIYNFEGGLALVQRDQNLGASGCLSHYAISHAGTGLTCQQSQVTITAHDSLHGNITMPNNTTQIQLTTAGGIGDWTLISGYGTLNNGAANDGAATYLFNGEYQAVFGLNYPSAATVNINVTDGQFKESEDPGLVITTCLTARFNACELTATRCVPSGASFAYAKLWTKLANTAFLLDFVKLKIDGTLETTYSNSATVDLLVNTNTGVALSANNCPVSQTAVIPLGSIAFNSGRSNSLGITVPANAFSAVAPNYSAYRDVRVRVTCNAASCGTATTGCSTDNFAIRPRDLTVASTMTNAAQTGTPKLNAGAPFTVSATAVAGYNGTPLIDNTLLGQKIVTHVGATDYTGNLGSTGGISPIPIGTATIATGLASNATMKYDDVGNFSIKAGGISDQTYTSTDQPSDCVAGSSSNTADSNGKFGCIIANQSASAQFGRFYPDHYAINAFLGAACNGFTYMGQPNLTIGVLATALSSNDVPLNHYTSGYPTLATMVVSGDSSGTPISPLNSRLTPDLPSYFWTNGNSGRSVATNGAGYATGATVINLLGIGVVLNGDSLMFSGDPNTYQVTAGGTMNTVTPVAVTITPPLLLPIPAASTGVNFLHSFDRLSTQDGPYDNFALKTVITDPDGANITRLNGVPITASNTILYGSTKLRYGRMRIENAYGSELLPLSVNLAAQYWNGSAYVTNTLDNCTSLARANYSLNGHAGGVTAANMTTATNIPANTGVTMTSGIGTIKLLIPITPPVITSKGSFNLNSLFPYLPGLGRQTLGVYKNAPIIFIREIH
ncbi:DUF6701 domain-containing protein [Undibacterium sp.]|uniref:DUF6701 domain-containing protein n=1 Tax=Undibacterium sp. TaxID=1914977 RepID=UPI00375082C7